ncbi:MAG: WYL domain-containing protein [Clostridia bacterium]|nr:WYL domain-containing protein [Clostridia bacterium]
MGKTENQKLKLLYLRQLLEQESDEQHPLSMSYIIERLARLGIKAERKSIYSDMEYLQQFGMDILLKKGRGGGYYLASRDFELPELKLLVDAVQASKFLSEKKSMQLISKLSDLAGIHNAGQLKRQVVVSGRVKTMNESIFYNVDRLHEAIAHNRQVSFRYFDWSLSGEKAFRPGVYTASPYALLWDDENYYLIAHSERHGLTHYRVDKMAQIAETDQPRYLDDQARSLDLSQYGRNVFGMFGGEARQIRLRFHNSLVGVVRDRFGKAAMLIPDGSEHFTYTAQIAVSPVFFGWLAGFGDRAKILWPEDVQEEYLKLCKLSVQQYETK